ncbi:hypothetical protein DIPPA_06132 [Diplonema papillatum]|nr:hypothetical protein DIPPA_06132 [Diplonema papillatum]
MKTPIFVENHGKGSKEFPALSTHVTAVLATPLSVTGVEKKRCATMDPQTFVNRLFLRHGDTLPAADDNNDADDDLEAPDMCPV